MRKLTGGGRPGAVALGRRQLKGRGIVRMMGRRRGAGTHAENPVAQAEEFFEKMIRSSDREGKGAEAGGALAGFFEAVSGRPGGVCAVMGDGGVAATVGAAGACERSSFSEQWA